MPRKKKNDYVKRQKQRVSLAETSQWQQPSKEVTVSRSRESLNCLKAEFRLNQAPIIKSSDIKNAQYKKVVYKNFVKKLKDTYFGRKGKFKYQTSPEIGGHMGSFDGKGPKLLHCMNLEEQSPNGQGENFEHPYINVQSTPPKEKKVREGG